MYNPQSTGKAGALKTLLLAGLVSLVSLPALADKNPQPKASGIVIHLFGPETITMPNTSGTPSANTTAQAGTAGTTSYEPSMGQLMHIMFVTGDPTQDSTPHFPHGRAASNHP